MDEVAWLRNHHQSFRFFFLFSFPFGRDMKGKGAKLFMPSQI
jgi:hypothetical protein